MNKSVTLKEIAEIAGVSVATVSYVLNDTKQVSAKTKERVLSIADRLNYSPNIMAKQLKTSESKYIFGLLNTYGGYYPSEVLPPLESKLKEKGYQLLTLTGNIPEIIRTNVFDGGIVLNYSFSEGETEKLVEAVNKPIILLSGNESGNNLGSVRIDNDHGIKLAIEEMSKSVHKNICFIQGKEDSVNNTQRRVNAANYFSEYFGKNDFDLRVYDGYFSSESSYKIGLQLLKNTNYDGFVCFNDGIALGLYKAATELGIKIGEDISVIGFDDAEFSSYLNPGLTTVHIDYKIWADLVVNAYLKLSKKDKNGTVDLLQGEIIRRGSINYK